MKRIVRLTERDLTRIVKRVIKEQEVGTAVQPDEPQIGTALSIYKVKPGDTLTKIAKEMKTTVADILKYNPDIKNPNLIKPGQEIEIQRK